MVAKHRVEITCSYVVEEGESERGMEQNGIKNRNTDGASAKYHGTTAEQ